MEDEANGDRNMYIAAIRIGICNIIMFLHPLLWLNADRVA